MLGIVGGMGPLASAEFVKTIYEYNHWTGKEQEAPKILLYSELLQRSLATSHVFGKPIILFLDQKLFPSHGENHAALLASLFLLVRTPPLFRHVAENSVYLCTSI